jgi:hypothetical protein
LPIDRIKPSPENDRLYRPIDAKDPEIIGLAASIREHGILDPLVITLDHFILSGHRRYAAAQIAGRKRVPCRTEPFRRVDDPDRFLVRLREHNRQREKSLDEKLREEIVSADPDASYAALAEYRREQARIEVTPLEIVGSKVRKRISAAKQPMVEAINRVLEERRDFWPLSDRAIHYALLNDPPLIHASKPHSRYTNTPESYKALVELLTRLRIAGSIPWEAIHDPTRPITTWQVWREPTAFIRGELKTFLCGYARDLQQSQPAHIEIVCEKNTVEPIIKQVAMEYRIPLTSGRGYCSLPPRHAMAQRFRRSGKDKLLLLMLSDFDPEGEDIAHSFARSMRDDFLIEAIHPIKVALTADQVAEYSLPPIMEAKEKSSRYRKFVNRHGRSVFELEALPPETLQRILREAIDTVLDLQLYNSEIARERSDAAYLAGVRKTVLDALQSLNLGGDE